MWRFKHPTLGYIDSKGEFDRRCQAKGLVRVSSDELTTRGVPTRPTMPKLDPNRMSEIVREVREQSKNPDLVNRKWKESHELVEKPLSPVGVDYAKPA